MERLKIDVFDLAMSELLIAELEVNDTMRFKEVKKVIQEFVETYTYYTDTVEDANPYYRVWIDGINASNDYNYSYASILRTVEAFTEVEL